MKSWFLPGLLILFSLISIITLRSVAQDLASTQVVFYVIALVVFWLTSKVSFTSWVNKRWLLYIGLVLLLVLTLIIGTITRGTARWISVAGLFSIQGSQLAVPIVGLVAAHLVANNPLTSYKKLINYFLIIGLPAALIAVAPDLGTTIIFLLSMIVLVITSQTPWRYIWQMIGLGVFVIVLSWLFLLQPYQKQRITSFLSSSPENIEEQYNARQALIAVGSGKIIGRGLGHGIQSQLRFLPERQTDFIFASLAEEWGFVGSSTVLILYISLVAFLLNLSLKVGNETAKQYIFVTITMLTIQTSVNIGMNMNLFPITGVTLPFLSYGGSSLVALTFNMGIIQNLAVNNSSRESKHLS